MFKSRDVTINISNRTIVRAILWIAGAFLLFKSIGRVSHVLTLIFISFFLSLAINPVVSWMSRRLKIESRVRATAAAYLTVIVIVAAFLALTIPPLVTQTRDFIKTVPQSVENFQSQDSNVSRFVYRHHLNDRLDQAAKDFTSHYSNFGTTVLNTGRRVVGAVASVFVVIVLTFMMLVEGPKWFKMIINSMPDRDREQNNRIAHRIYKSVSGFVNGQVVLALIAGFFAFIMLEVTSHILNVSINPVALAGIVTMLGIIPLFGNLVSSTIVILACLLNSTALAIVMLIYFVLYFFIESHSLQPYLQSKLNELTPLTVFIAALIGIEFAGFLGAVVAIPVASTIKILLEEHFKGRITLKDLT